MIETCPRCKGSGQVPYQPPANLPAGPGSQTRNCPRCRGEGRVDFLRDGEAPVLADQVQPPRRGGFLG